VNVLAANVSPPKTDRIPVRLVFTTGSDLYQVAIRALTFSPASHVAIALGKNGETLLHAIERGVVLEPRSHWFGAMKQRLVAEYVVLPDVTEGVYEAMRHVDAPYDLPGIFKIIVLRALRFVASPVNSFGPIPDWAHTCALFAMLLDPAGRKIPEWRHINREAVAPGDLLLAAAGPSFMRVG